MNRKVSLWEQTREAAKTALRPMQTSGHAVRRRTRVVAGVLCCAMLGLGWRAFDVSVLQHDQYLQRGNRQQLRTFRLPAGRGDILDRNYVSLAVNNQSFRVVLNPRVIRRQGRESEVLSHLTRIFPDLDPEYVSDELSRDKAYRMLRLKVAPEEARQLRDLKLPGIRLEQKPERIYPRGHLAAHLLGRVDNRGAGNLGVELAADNSLKGRDTTSPAFYAAHRGRGKQLLVEGHPDPALSRGNDVVLTIDTAIQSMAEREINTLVAKWRPVGASIIVLEPATGEILALANRPTFDPNHKIGSVNQTRNLAVQSAYEPGSTLKAITVAAALEQGVIRKDETFFCHNGRWQYTPQHSIRDTKRSEYLTVTEVLATSSNICTTKIYERLGKEALYRWAKKFHFGRRPNVQLPGAAKGLLADWEKWSDIQAANISFGQGMSASPLQVAAAFATLANGGLYNEPTLITQITDATGGSVWTHTPERERIVSESTARTTLEMLTAVVHSKKGTGKNARIEGFRVAGKTSTAQKANPLGGYFEDQYYASFVGALPAENPEVVILVSVDNPEGGHYGNQVAAPAFRRLGTAIMNHLGVADQEQLTLVPNSVALDSADPRLSEGFFADVDVEPRLPGQRPAPFTTGLPDFTGLTITQALSAAEKAHVRLIATGSGLAVGQSTPPGEVDAGTSVHVHFEPAY
ncbi:MAG: penicillin-binding protein [Nannocystaceae bacterium]